MRGKDTDRGRREVLAWLWRLPVLAAVAGAGYALLEARRVLFGKRAADDSPEFIAREPVEVGPVEAFARPWDAVRFEMAGDPAIALRLPEAVAGGLSRDALHLAAFSRICTHQGCTVTLNRDNEAIAFGFNYRSDTPELVCPCHLSVFSPSMAGRAMSGPAVEPLPRIRLELAGDRVLAVGVERPEA